MDQKLFIIWFCLFQRENRNIGERTWESIWGETCARRQNWNTKPAGKAHCQKFCHLFLLFSLLLFAHQSLVPWWYICVLLAVDNMITQFLLDYQHTLGLFRLSRALLIVSFRRVTMTRHSWRSSTWRSTPSPLPERSERRNSSNSRTRWRRWRRRTWGCADEWRSWWRKEETWRKYKTSLSESISSFPTSTWTTRSKVSSVVFAFCKPFSVVK